MVPEELKRSYAMNHVWPIEKFDLCPVADAHLVIKLTHTSIFVRYPLIYSHYIIMASLYHERPGCHQVG